MADYSCDNTRTSTNPFQDDIIYDTMFRLTNGLPQHELSQMIQETRECELALAYEIQVLEKAAGLPVTSSFSNNEIILPLSATSKTFTASLTSDSPPASQKKISSTQTNKNDLKSLSSEKVNHDSDSKTNNTTAEQSHNIDNVIDVDNESVIQNSSPMIPPAYDATIPFVKDICNNNKSDNGATITDKNYLERSDDIIETEMTPIDRYFTLSSLLGRLREPINTPPPPHSSLAKLKARQIQSQQKKGQFGVGDSKKKKKGSSNLSSTGNVTPNLSISLSGIPPSIVVMNAHQQKQLEKYRKLIHLTETFKIYNQVQTDTTALLAFHKRISNHRTATVFRRPVNPQEAPGYIDRILFPCDLSLVKKMILCGVILTFEEMHRKVGLICHNCVKFNGRESDYAHLARDFENYVDDSMLDTMQKLTDKLHKLTAR